MSSVPQANALHGTRAPRRHISHRIQVWIAALAAVALVAAIGIYGFSYYLLPIDQRPYSDKHEFLKPSGAIGLKLGVLGTVLFFLIFLYALRRVIPILGRWGTARHWMDFHVIFGLTAPVIIAYHASFKFQGIAGVAFWIMLAVAVSGVVGRYLYAQIPRSLGAANVGAKELASAESELSEALRAQPFISSEMLERVFKFPSPQAVREVGALRAVPQMIALDISRPFQVAYLRRSVARATGVHASLAGFLHNPNHEVERAISLAREKAAISKRVLFLEKTQKVFHLWHVVHRPFSYGFAVLAIIHIAVVLGFGFVGMGLH
jgi:hypothetical protein